MKCGLPLKSILISRVEKGKNDSFAGRNADLCVFWTRSKKVDAWLFSVFNFGFSIQDKYIIALFRLHFFFDIFCLQVSYVFFQLIGRYQVFSCEVASTDLFRLIFVYYSFCLFCCCFCSLWLFIPNKKSTKMIFIKCQN